ncbi:MAG: hypothetical protein ACPG4Q_03885, partial [Phycisphaeraceae bacterium]|jgi:hypothetical protein
MLRQERFNQPSPTTAYAISAAGESKALDVSEDHIASAVHCRVGRLAHASPGSGFSRLATTPILPTKALSAR